jgi:hypothetical protein
MRRRPPTASAGPVWRQVQAARQSAGSVFPTISGVSATSTAESASTTFEVTAYRTLWFGLQYDSETVEQGGRSGTVRSRRCAGTTARQYLKWELAERVEDRQELLIPAGESPFEKATLNHS